MKIFSGVHGAVALFRPLPSRPPGLEEMFSWQESRGSLRPPMKHEITREQLAQLAIRRYEGRIELVETVQELERVAQEIRREEVVGIDTETRPAFHVGQSYLPSLVQIAGSQAVYLFQLKRLEFAEVLVEVLELPKLIKAGIGLTDDFVKLKQVFAFKPNNVVDLGVVAKRQGIKQPGVRNMAGSLLGFRVPKGSQTSNWSSPRLSRKQLIYAATDAWVCRELYLRFQQLGFLGQTGKP
jgi:hypothetical protein